MRKLFNLKIFGVMLLLCLFFWKAEAQTSFNKTPEQLVKIKFLAAKVEANPSDLKAHENFIDAFDDPALSNQYQNWIKKYPQSFVIPFIIGKILVNHENLKATPYLYYFGID